MSAHVDQNRAAWDADSDRYQAEQGAFLSIDRPAWGVWQVPEDELNVLGDVAGRDVLELGCGAAQWGIALAKRGANVTGLDVSERQLAHARENMATHGVEFPLVQANAEDTALTAASFDIVFCDHGALTFTDPYRTVPEVARLLRPGGLFAFSHLTPLAHICSPLDSDDLIDRLVRPYFGLRQIEFEGKVDFQLPYGRWIRLLADSGFELLDLLELQPEPDATSAYCTEQDRDWARKWPLDQIWRARRRRA